MKYLLILALTGAVSAAPLVGAKGSVQARDAAALLTAKGIIRGYPGGVYKGDRVMSRYETASMVNQLNDYLLARMSGNASKEELRALETTVDAVHRDLEALEDRTDNLEHGVRTETLRTNELTL